MTQYIVIFVVCSIVGVLNGYLVSRWSYRRAERVYTRPEARWHSQLDEFRQLQVEQRRLLQATAALTKDDEQALVAAVVAAVNGNLGGKIGLGFQRPMPPGSTAGL